MKPSQVPKDAEGKRLDIDWKDPAFIKFMRVAEKRTGCIALEMTLSSSPLTLRQALAAAYWQGMYDCTLLKGK